MRIIAGEFRGRKLDAPRATAPAPPPTASANRS